MNRIDYWVKDIKPEDLSGCLKLAGSQGWELCQMIILQTPKNFVQGSYPSIEITYRLILKRFLISQDASEPDVMNTEKDFPCEVKEEKNEEGC